MSLFLRLLSRGWIDSTTRAIVTVFFLFSISSSFVDAHKILLLPISINSHLIYFGKLGQGLAGQGHQVEMLMPSSARAPAGLETPGFTMTSYDVKTKESLSNSLKLSEQVMKYALADNKFFAMFSLYKWMVQNMIPVVDRECESLLDNEPLMKRIVNETKFEFVILDLLSTDCYIQVVRALKVPYTTFGLAMAAWHFGVPRLPSFVPNLVTPMSDRMTFFERLQTLLSDIAVLAFSSKNRPDFRRPYAGSRDSEVQENLEILRNSDIMLYLEDPVVGYPRPNMPHILSIGDIVVGQKGFPLPKSIEEFLSDSEDALLMSFGSYIEMVSDEISRKYCRAFEFLPDLKIIWKSKNTSLCGKHLDNVLFLPWIPQNDLLADRRVKVFITHGGFNSIMESIYHAKPVIVFPLAGDQQFQASSASRKEHGIEMNIRFWQAQDLIDNIVTIMVNPKYKKNARYYSSLLKDRAFTPAQRVSNAINHVIKFGSNHLKSASLDLHWFQYFMFDLCLFMLVVVLSLVITAVCCLRLTIRCIFFRNSGRKKLKKN